MLINRVLKTKDLPSYYASELSRAIVVMANNVAEYFYEKNDQEFWDLSEDFPNVAPPWPTIWVEWPEPKFINSRVHGIKQNPNYRKIARTAVLLKFAELGDLPPMNINDQIVHYIGHCYMEKFQKNGVELTPQLLKHLEHILEEARKHISPEHRELFKQNVLSKLKQELISLKETSDSKWIMTASLMVEDRKGMIHQGKALPQGFIDKNGKFIGADPRKSDKGISILCDPAVVKEFGELLTNNLATILHVPFLTLSFLHCKNVKLQENKLPQKLSDRFRTNRKKKSPAYKYYVLDIEPMKQVLKTEGDSEKTGLKKALHICRGHFATYTAEAPLFGKVTGIFWRPMHLRGSQEAGVVAKDYQIKVPQ